MLRGTARPAHTENCRMRIERGVEEHGDSGVEGLNNRFFFVEEHKSRSCRKIAGTAGERGWDKGGEGGGRGGRRGGGRRRWRAPERVLAQGRREREEGCEVSSGRRGHG